MRYIVILKSGRYYICTGVHSADEDSVTYCMTRGGTVNISRGNIDSVERYSTDSQIEYGLRTRLRSLEQNENFQEM